MQKETGSCFTTIIEANTAEELKAKVLALAASYGGSVVSAPTVEVPAASAPSSEAPKSGKKGKKESAPAPVTPPAPVAAEEAAPAATKEIDPFADDEEEVESVVEPKKLTFDDVKGALQKVADKKGMDVARGIVGKFSEKGKISTVKEADYQAFVDACEKA